ncbi:hypothetical protein QNH98_11215 [Myroides sp. mNGS23_01]|nr:hypothetical protein [Myroides sp. mNGS23_01]WHT37733.1 hypothetical protein QNH98_11215 [Myroides sp. mNGS23_01]
MYYLGGDKSKSLRLRKEEFSIELLRLMKEEGEDFDTIYMKDLDHVEQVNDIFEVDYTRLNALFK